MKYRLDQLIVDKKLLSSREKAKGHILAGNVLVNNEIISKVGYLVDEKVNIRLKKLDRYVSRGGIKLEKALTSFSIEVSNQVILDVGASTGGFADCLLQNDAQMVYCVDVGFNQLDYSLRNNPKIKSIEKLNAKNLSLDYFEHPLDLAVMDVSFISLTKILKAVLSVLDKKVILALIKPQFEIGSEISNFKGVVKNPEDHCKALQQVNNYALTLGLVTNGVTYSPIKGPKGNIEFFIYWSSNKVEEDFSFESIVKKAYEDLID